MSLRPSWAWGSADGSDRTDIDPLLLGPITREAALGGSTGKGVRVGIVDSGIDDDHPAVGGMVRGWVEPSEDATGKITYATERHGDLYGHGTACAGIVHRIAPEAELYSIRVLGKGLGGKGAVFAAGLRWAFENGMHVVNLSLGTTKKDFYAKFHELVDGAYFKRTVLVTAANNMPTVSYPSLFASVLSVACHRQASDARPTELFVNPKPPVEYGAPGEYVRVAWLDKGYATMTGNSFAAPHVTGVVALLLGKHPALTPYQIKTVLSVIAQNAQPPPSVAPG